MTVEPPPEDLPVEIIIIVGSICGFIVIVLLIILIILCCRRHQSRKKDYHEQQANGARQAPPPTQNSNGVKPVLKNGIDNPGMDMVDMENSSTRGGHTTPQTLLSQANGGMGVYHTQQQHQHRPHSPNGHMNGHPPPMNGGPHWNRMNGNGPPTAPPPYENQLNDHYESQRKQNKSPMPGGLPENDYVMMQKPKKIPRDPPVLHLDNPYSDPHYRANSPREPDSGLSTPDPTKPKKVIHEVVV